MMHPKVIAEIGCNHQGDFELAKKMVRIAAEVCGVYAVKFQKRTISEMPKEVRDRPYDNKNSFGKTYGEHREALELTLDQHLDLIDLCRSLNVKYSCSVWDIQAAKDFCCCKSSDANIDMIKIPSACNTNYELIRYLMKNFDGQIHVSMGMTTLNEKIIIKKHLDAFASRCVVYHCTSSYPIEKWSDLSLRDITHYRKWMRDINIKDVGYSGHHRGIAADMLAYSLGATYIERHFTLDRTLKGTDHAASLEPIGMMKLVRDLNMARDVMCVSDLGVKECEISARKKLKNED